MNNAKRHHLLPVYLIIILAISLFLRVWQLSLYGLWTDEFATYWCSTAPTLSSCIKRAAMTQGQSPFYFVLQWLILAVLPASEWSVRLLSLIASMGCVLLAYYLGLRFFRNGRSALASALAMGLNITMVYYSQEARPYALALALAMLSQLFFMRYLAKPALQTLLLYCLFSILACYGHYFMGPLLIAQNLYCVYLIFVSKKLKASFLTKWLAGQLVIALSFLFLLFQIYPMLENRNKWQWLHGGSLLESIQLFLGMFDFAALTLVVPLILILMVATKRNWRHVFSAHRDSLVMLGLWWLSPFLFCLAMTKLLGNPLIAERYLVLAVIPFSLFTGKLLTLFPCRKITQLVVVVFSVCYLFSVLLPPLRSQAIFSYRISHDWRGAIRFIDTHFQNGDAILLRSGFVKENWIPTTRDTIIIDYAKSPFHSFYWSSRHPVEQLPLYSMTYTMEKQFYPYYDDLIDNKLRTANRIWILGVNPPNTNYPVKNLANLVRQRLKFVSTVEKNFSGVYLTLLSRPE